MSNEPTYGQIKHYIVQKTLEHYRLRTCEYCDKVIATHPKRAEGFVAHESLQVVSDSSHVPLCIDHIIPYFSEKACEEEFSEAVYQKNLERLAGWVLDSPKPIELDFTFIRWPDRFMDNIPGFKQVYESVQAAHEAN